MTDIEKIKSKLDIVDVITSYGVEAKRAGSNFKASCPFHNEKTASFMINPQIQIFKCFGCGKGGDLIRFIEEFEKVSFPDAIKIAAEKAGVELENTNFKKDKKLEEEKKRLVEANTFTAKFYNYVLKTLSAGLSGRSYAEKRKIDGKRIEDFMVGYAPKSYSALKTQLLKRGFSETELVKWGLLVERNGSTIDKFRERLMQPILNTAGDVVGFSGRYIGTNKDTPKYLNSPETLVYKKNELLYGLYQGKDEIRKQKFLIMVEGNIDILSSHRVGVQNIVAPLGTAFTSNQAKLVKRFADQVYFCFDTDGAGMKALERGIDIVEKIGLKHKVIDITGFQDADELIIKNPSLWPERVAKPVNSVEYLFEYHLKDLDMTDPDDKSEFRDRVMPVINSLSDEVQQTFFMNKLAEIVGVKEDQLEKRRKRNPIVHEEEPREYVPLNKVKIEGEEFLAAVIIQNKSKVKKEFKREVFEHPAIRQMISNFLDGKEQSGDQDFEHYSKIMTIDVSRVKDVSEEINYRYKLLYKAYLKQYLKKLSSGGVDSEEMSEITKTIEALKNIDSVKII